MGRWYRCCTAAIWSDVARQLESPLFAMPNKPYDSISVLSAREAVEVFQPSGQPCSQRLIEKRTSPSLSQNLLATLSATWLEARPKHQLLRTLRLTVDR